MPSLRTGFGGWLDPATAKGRLGLQSWLNSFLITLVTLTHAMPWLALALVSLAFAATLALHGAAKAPAILVYAVLGYVGELWIVGFGGVWRFANPTVTGLYGGLFGVPFYMLPVWGMVGCLMIVLVEFMTPAKQ